LTIGPIAKPAKEKALQAKGQLLSLPTNYSHPPEKILSPTRHEQFQPPQPPIDNLSTPPDAHVSPKKQTLIKPGF
jgi:hypothetical protein